MPSRTVLLAGVGVVLVVVWALSGLGVIDVNFLFPTGSDATRVTVDDKSGDCREAGRDTGERCDVGADIETVTVWQPDDRTLMVELELTQAPDLDSGLEWTVELYAETRNAFTAGGIICGLSNVVDGTGPSAEAVAYALKNRFTEEQLGAEACDGRLEGSSARFTIDVTGQPDEAEFRIIGSVKLEYPDRPDHRGSEDDFLVRTSLLELR